MKRHLIRASMGFMFVCVSLSVFGQQGVKPNEDSHQSWKVMDDSLNNVYDKIVLEYASQQEFVANLKNSQNTWHQLRDANIAMQYPGYKENPNKYGSAVSLCINNELRKMTEARVVYLNQWLHGIQEGDVCSGSIKMLTTKR